jgi:hypothetical protein
VAGAITYLQSATDTADLSTYTFASQNLGSASSDRYIIVSFTTRLLGTSTVTINSVTVAGVSATIIAQLRTSSSNTNAVCLAIAAVPTGTSGDVVVVISRTALRANIQLYSATGIDPTVVDSATSGVASPTYAIDVPADGIAVAALMAANVSSCAWSGLTERYDFIFDGSGFASGAADAFASTQTNLSVTATPSPAGDEKAGAFASFGPATGGGGGVPVARAKTHGRRALLPC